MADPKLKAIGVEVSFTGVGNDDRVPYAKADFTKFCAVGESIGLSFYQLDYSAFANAAAGLSSLKPSEVRLMPVSKIVLDREGFSNLIAELERFRAIVFPTP